MQRSLIPSYLFLSICLLANFIFWTYSHNRQATWSNVPPAPIQHSAGMIALGDDQMAYRFYALMLQNLGNTGGRYISLADYDFNKLKEWFLLVDVLDPVSNAVPMMAANYFGSVQDKSKLGPVLDYLAVVGQRPYGEKWRWLGHAVYLARHEQKDNDRALELAYLLAANEDPDLADWARQMPAFVLQAKGETEMAYQIMLNILISNVDTLHPNEINYMTDHICNVLLKDLPHIAPPSFCESK